jgi:N6-adenosine-specific RNA methylase IME4
MGKKYQVIVADMPWSFSDQLSMSDVKRGAKANYSTMAIKDIKKLPIEKIADTDGCLLALWVPSSLLKEGIEVMEAYGFHLKTTYIWTKTKKISLGE